MSDAIAGAVGALRMLADGSVSVTIVFDPKDRMAVMSMMGEPGASIACVRLVDGHAQAGAKPAESSYRELGPICREAIDLCSNEKFLFYISRSDTGAPKWNQTPEAAKGYILSHCCVESRKELDTEPGARQAFIELVRKPFQQWLRQQA